MVMERGRKIFKETLKTKWILSVCGKQTKEIEREADSMLWIQSLSQIGKKEELYL